MATRGRMRWLPAPLITELEDIKKREGLNNDHDAANKLLSYAQNGRKIHDIMSLDLLPKKKKRGLF